MCTYVRTPTPHLFNWIDYYKRMAPPGPGGLVPFIDINLGRRWVLLKIAQARARIAAEWRADKCQRICQAMAWRTCRNARCTLCTAARGAEGGGGGGASGSAVIFISHTHFASILGVLSGYLYSSMRKLIADTFYANMADVEKHANMSSMPRHSECTAVAAACACVCEHFDRRVE